MRKILSKAETILIIPLLAGMVLLVFSQIICRFSGRSFSFTEEINQQFFIWLTMLGIALAVRRRELLGLQVFSRTGSVRRKKVFAVSRFISIILYAFLLFLFSLKMVWMQFHTGKMTPAMGWPIWIIGLAVPVGCCLMILRTIESS